MIGNLNQDLAPFSVSPTAANDNGNGEIEEIDLKEKSKMTNKTEITERTINNRDMDMSKNKE